MDKNSDVNTWVEWSKHVLLELERLNVVCTRTQEEVVGLRLSLKELETEFKFKSGMWGAISAVITVVAMLLWKKIEG
jgi:hypothetical protein